MGGALAAASGGAGGGEGDEPIPLPPVRDDLEVVRGAPLASGAPTWVIFDPVGNRYFEIGRDLLDMLTLWRAGTVQQLIKDAKREFDRHFEREDVEAAIHFLISSALTRDIPGGDYRMMAHKEAEQRKSWLSTAMHSYLFFRIPLVRPDRFLQATWPYVAFLFSVWAVRAYLVVGLAGLYLVSRQWEGFKTTFQFMLSWEGAILYGLSLVAVKSVHELGHAYMAVKHGLRVPTIGIAFMVLMPVLYTDTSGAWRLRSRRDRLMIDGAGIFTELALAAVATFLWVFLPDGGVRLAVFAVATTSWITSLLVNLNPLMRFDGYYILSDALGFQNLQNRGFEMARWRLREALFGLGRPPPETLSVRMRRVVILHAWATWIYRFFLFLGIAILVYAFFIKIVGILLFIVEIIWFIARPVMKEIAHWWSIRSEIMLRRRTYITAAVVAGLVAVAVVPWSTTVTVPAVVTAAQEQRIFAPLPARVAALHIAEGKRVAAGDMLVRLEAPQLDADLKLARERQSLLETRIDRAGSDAQDRASLIVLTNELEEVRERIEGLARTRETLTVRAPFDGTVRDVDGELHEGLWVGVKAPMALVQSERGARAKGYVREADVFRVAEGAQARFVPDDPDIAAIDMRLAALGEASVEQLEEPYLAMPFGGPIATEEGREARLRPTAGAYAAHLVPLSGTDITLPPQAVRGVALVEGAPKSFYERAKLRVLSVLVRETGV